MATLSADNVRRAYFKDEHIDFSGIHRLSRTPGGFQNHEVRKLLWPTLLGIENKDVCKKFSTFVDNKHRDIQQISNDIDRSLWKQDCLQDWSLERRQVERLRLQNIINAVLARNEALHYYQGFHDICSIFYLVFEDDPLTFSCIEALALYFIRDDMRENFDSVMELMRLVFVVIEKVDFELYQYLTATKAEPFFTISWLLTWFAHDISHMQDIARLYDAILCSHPIYIIYLCSSFTMYYRSALMSKERDFGSVQNFFVKAPTVLGVPLEDIIRDADTIYSLFPEDELVRCSSAHMKELLGSHSVTILEDVPARFYAANNSTNCNDNDKIDSHKPKSAKKQSKTKALLCSWRQSDLPILARKRQHSFLPPSRFSLYVYKKLGRRLYPYILGLGSFANSVNPFSPGFWPALFFNQLLFMEGKQLAVSVLSVAVIGGFLGFGLGGYFVNSIP